MDTGYIVLIVFLVFLAVIVAIGIMFLYPRIKKWIERQKEIAEMMKKSMTYAYTKELNQRYEYYFANYMPSREIQIGFFGILDGYHFLVKGNMKTNYDIDVKKVEGSGGGHLLYTSRDVQAFDAQTSLGIDLKDASSVGGKENISLRFRNRNALFFNASGCKYWQIESELDLESNIKKLIGHQEFPWQQEYVVVTDIVEAAVASIAAAREDDAECIIEADASVGGIDLANASTSFKISDTRETTVRDVWKDPENPPVVLFGLCKLGSKGLTKQIYKPPGEATFRGEGIDLEEIVEKPALVRLTNKEDRAFSRIGAIG